MLRRTLPLAVLVALVVPAPAGAEVTVRVGGDASREVLYPGTFRIKGKTGEYRGPVTLEVDEFPYDDAYADVATVNTDDRGEYVFPTIGPTRNARVRARAGGERSAPVEVFVHPGIKDKMGKPKNDRLRFVSTYTGHPGFSPPADSFFIYMQKRGEKKLRRLGSGRTMVQIGDGRWRYDGTVKLPSSRRTYYFRLLTCTRGLAAAGYGRMLQTDRHCGEKVIPFPAG